MLTAVSPVCQSCLLVQDPYIPGEIDFERGRAHAQALANSKKIEKRAYAPVCANVKGFMGGDPREISLERLRNPVQLDFTVGRDRRLIQGVLEEIRKNCTDATPRRKEFTDMWQSGVCAFNWILFEVTCTGVDPVMILQILT